MIINFSELNMPVHRLATGAVLVSPNDVRYMKVIDEQWEFCWVQDKDILAGSCSSDAQMKDMIGDGEGWKVLP